MTKKIFHSIILAVTAVLIVSFAAALVVLYTDFVEQSKTQLKDELELAAQGVELEGVDYLNELHHENYRITWVAADGSVIYDSDVDISSMNNHADREEIKFALENGYAEATRYSDTLTTRMLYSAKLMSDGSVLRISTAFDSIFAMLTGILFPMIVIMLFAVLISSLLAKRMAQSIVKPLNELDLENPTENDTYEELSPLLSKINKQHKQIDDQVKTLRRKTDEFEQITTSMNEGLIVLDKNGTIISVNLAARKLFEIDSDARGRNFLEIDRTPEINRAVINAFNGNNGDFRENRSGREYQFSVSTIESGGKTVGAVILCFDITESTYAERNRKEFTANVSHELKTPLQSIIGSTELLENGLVKPEDTGRFIGNIKKEAARLVTLINDIIRLSQLDENVGAATEAVNLYDVAKEVVDILSTASSEKNVTVELKGENCTIIGVRRYLYEIIYNLCDNAIRYNVPQGKVNVDLRSENSSIILTVSDTGIGIPLEHQSRIFERFYRVDKSHSKETGGTGLGLSIVKHAIAYHNGTINVESVVGKGTTFTVIFKN